MKKQLLYNTEKDEYVSLGIINVTVKPRNSRTVIISRVFRCHDLSQETTGTEILNYIPVSHLFRRHIFVIPSSSICFTNWSFSASFISYAYFYYYIVLHLFHMVCPFSPFGSFPSHYISNNAFLLYFATFHFIC